MRRASVWAVICGLTLPAFACSRSELFDFALVEPLDGADGGDAGPDGEALLDGATDAPPLAILTCPKVSQDVCGTNMYQAGAPWPTYQRCSSHAGRTDIVGPTKPVIKWSTGALTEGVLGPPTVGADGTIYITTNGSLDAFRPDGTPRWSTALSELNVGSSTVAIGPDGTIFAALDRVYALDPGGAIKWTSLPLLVPGAGGPVFGALGSSGSSVALGPCGTLYIGSELGLLMMDQNGNEIWDHGGQGLTPAVDSTGTSYYGAVGGQLYAVSALGATVWSFVPPALDARAPGWIQPAPVLGPDGTLYYGETAGLYAVSRGGAERWRLPWAANTPAGSIASAALGADGTIYLAAPDSTLEALSPDGKLEWSLPISGAGTAPVVDGNGTIYELGSKGVYAVNRAGSVLWTLLVPDPLGGAFAFGTDGTLYVTTSGLYAIGNAP